MTPKPVLSITATPTTPASIFESRYGPPRVRVPNMHYFSEDNPAPKTQPKPSKPVNPPSKPRSVKRNAAPEPPAREYPHRLHRFLLEHAHALGSHNSFEANEQGRMLMAAFYEECGPPPLEVQKLDVLVGQSGERDKSGDVPGPFNKGPDAKDPPRKRGRKRKNPEGVVKPPDNQQNAPNGGQVPDMFFSGAHFSTGERAGAGANIGFSPTPFDHTLSETNPGEPMLTPGGQAANNVDFGTEALSRELRRSGRVQQQPTAQQVFDDQSPNHNQSRSVQQNRPSASRRGRLPQKQPRRIHLENSTKPERQECNGKQEEAATSPKNRCKLTIRRGMITGTVGSFTKATPPSFDAISAPVGKSITSLSALLPREGAPQEVHWGARGPSKANGPYEELGPESPESPPYEASDSDFEGEEEEDFSDDSSVENENDIQVRKRSRR